MARGHHHPGGGGKPHEHPHPGHPMHGMHRADGGKIPGEEGKVESYTAKPNEVEEEAEGKNRKRGGRRASGGAAAVARNAGGRTAAFKDGGRHHEEEREERKDGGEVKEKKHAEMEGHKTKHRRMDRPGRKRGGGIGADLTPLSTAARTKQEGHHADNDELAEG